VYDSASVSLYIVNLEVEGYKYIWRDAFNHKVKLYNLDHSLFKTMPFPNVTWATSYPYAVLYVSEHLFNLDDSVEYMFAYQDGITGQYCTRILNETGTLLFSADTIAPLVQPNVPQAQQPIYNTTNGTKMILSFANGNYGIRAHVYSLGGTLTNSIEPTGLSSEDIEQLSIHPNPNDGNATIEFKLPQGIREGEIVLYRIDGSEVKRYKVDGTFGNLILNNSGLSAGTYMYQLIAGSKAVDAKRMIVVH
jgi:hypothetical protein